MGRKRKEVEQKINAQRLSIREHIYKYETYSHKEDKKSALDTISRWQDEISDLKRCCNVDIEESEEDFWTL